MIKLNIVMSIILLAHLEMVAMSLEEQKATLIAQIKMEDEKSKNMWQEAGKIRQTLFANARLGIAKEESLQLLKSELSRLDQEILIGFKTWSTLNDKLLELQNSKES